MKRYITGGLILILTMLLMACSSAEPSGKPAEGRDGAVTDSLAGDDTYMIERFADYCRYIYAYDGGRLNDREWQLQSRDTEDSFVTSVRFWVWLDYTYSDEKKDIMKEMAMQLQIHDKEHDYDAWLPDGRAWDTVFASTKAEGRTLTGSCYSGAGMAYMACAAYPDGGG